MKSSLLILQLVGINILPLATLEAFEFVNWEKVGVVTLLGVGNYLFWKTAKSERAKITKLYESQIKDLKERNATLEAETRDPRRSPIHHS